MHESSRLFDAAGRKIRLNKRLSVFWNSGGVVPLSPNETVYSLAGFVGTPLLLPVPRSASFPLILTQAFRTIFAMASVRDAAAAGTVTINDLAISVVDLDNNVRLMEWSAYYSRSTAYHVVSTGVSPLVFNSDFLSQIGGPITRPTLDVVVSATSPALDSFVVQASAIIEIFDLVPSE
jgi:hypothetical protein